MLRKRNTRRSRPSRRAADDGPEDPPAGGFTSPGATPRGNNTAGLPWQRPRAPGEERSAAEPRAGAPHGQPPLLLPDPSSSPGAMFPRHPFLMNCSFRAAWAQTCCRAAAFSWGGRRYKSLLFNRGVGVGKATFNALYSSLLHLDFIPALPSTSSKRHVSLAASGCHL